MLGAESEWPHTLSSLPPEANSRSRIAHGSSIDEPPFTTPTGGDADLYVNAKYFGVVFASAESPEVAARLAVTQRPFRSLFDR